MPTVRRGCPSGRWADPVRRPRRATSPNRASPSASQPRAGFMTVVSPVFRRRFDGVSAVLRGVAWKFPACCFTRCLLVLAWLFDGSSLGIAWRSHGRPYPISCRYPRSRALARPVSRASPALPAASAPVLRPVSSPIAVGSDSALAAGLRRAPGPLGEVAGRPLRECCGGVLFACFGSMQRGTLLGMERLNERPKGSAPAAQDQKPPRLNADGSLTFTMPPLITDALAHLAELVDRFIGEVRTLCENSPDGDFVSLVCLNSLADRWAEVDRYALVPYTFMPRNDRVFVPTASGRASDFPPGA